MFSRVRELLGEALSSLLKLGGLAFLLLAAAEAALVGVLTAKGKLRSSRREGTRVPFPEAECEEVGLEGSEERLKLYLGYQELYEEMLEEIERAEETIFIETFTWLEDERGKQFVDALARKAREGVQVYAVFDSWANHANSEAFKQFPKEIHTLRFRPFARLTSFFNPANYIRTHRKTLSVDSRVAFLGGCNIGGLYENGWRDSHIRIRRDLVYEVEDAFAGFWNEHRPGDLPEIEIAREQRDWNSPTVLRVNDPTNALFPIRPMFISALNRAKGNVYLTTIYFTPSRKIRDSLLEASRGGADVQILIPEESVYTMADWFARRHFTELLQAGVRIFLYDPHYVIHAETVTIDGVWSTVGSCNIDSLSLFGLHETNLEIYSESFATEMERAFEVDKTNAREITLEEWVARPRSARLVERALTPLRPFA